MVFFAYIHPSRAILGCPQPDPSAGPGARLSIRPGHDPRGLVLGLDRPGHVAGAAPDRAAVTDVIIAIIPVIAADPVDEYPEDGRPPDPEQIQDVLDVAAPERPGPGDQDNPVDDHPDDRRVDDGQQRR